ncbi:TauD/TfdA dioxygenase family protein [Alteraurantiacibacter aquimixticola]|uniref:TauD/TfdA family dioxygenase n=1 Tax=Alteraurantiacibacter aquimixticola TaxID=2489173 RepID=A0A4T3EZH5_9SPHN|nr:TauD/TfdA family dioxygenase [Alteraurantiacibacter aquimixticola]TIX48954.1 TauD/TfdA family dioxygenase [Alteraurantiacibacter aquimixticola]
MPITVTPLSERFGAEISGVDITQPLDEATQAEIRAAQDKWGVTFWRNTGLDDASHVAFSRIFGKVELAPVHKGKAPRFSEPELFDASNVDAEGKIIDNPMRRFINAGNRLWHIDSSYMDVRSAQALLLCHSSPPVKAPTQFADARSAYDDLPQAMKDRIDGLQARHCYFYSRMKAGYPTTEEELDTMPHATQPVVLDHVASVRKSLYLGNHARDIVGMDREEGRALIEELNDWVTQDRYVIEVDYQPGDMSIWDNLCCYHRAGDFDDTAYARDMRRTTIREAGVEAADDHFTTMFAASKRKAEPATQE